MGLPSELADADWSEAWKEQLTAIEISSQLVVRPSFVSFRRRPGQHELVIDPGQAFGTGSHESTRLALEWVDALARDLAPDAQVLDVGCGTGVLALAALRLAPVRAVALDLDPLAAEATRENASRNALARRLRCFTGGVSALRPALRFELVVANLLRRELAPLLPDLATRLAPRGRLVLSGLLETERADVAAHAGRLGLVLRAEKTRSDAGDVTWLALCLSARS